MGRANLHFNVIYVFGNQNDALSFKSDRYIYRLKIMENAPKTIYQNLVAWGEYHQTSLAGWGLWPHICWWTATHGILAKSLTFFQDKQNEAHSLLIQPRV